MIKNIFSNGSINVSGGNSQYPHIDMSRPSSGMVRYNGNNQTFEVYDGMSWMTMSGNSVSIDINSELRELIEWARAKRAEEEYMKRESEKNPTIKDLLNQRNNIDSKITMVKTLLQNCKVCDIEEQVQSSP